MALLSFYESLNIWSFYSNDLVSYPDSFVGTNDAGSFNNSVAEQQVCS